MADRDDQDEVTDDERRLTDLLRERFGPRARRRSNPPERQPEEEKTDE